MRMDGALKRGGIAVAALIAGLAAAHAGSLKIESWRNDDADIWNSKIIPAFNKHYPDIKVEFAPSAPKEYNAALNARLAGGTAGDIIACRPFDASLDLYNKHQLDGVNDLKGMDNFSDVAKSAWTTDDGKTTFCVPMASVIHGFIYNEDAFKKVGITSQREIEQAVRSAVAACRLKGNEALPAKVTLTVDRVGLAIEIDGAIELE